MKSILKILIVVLALMNNKCASVKEVQTFNDLSEAHQNKDLQIITKDSAVYYVNSFAYTDSTIFISGKKVKNEIGTDFDGPLSFKDIVYMQSSDQSIINILLIAGITGYIVYKGSGLLTSESGIEPNVKITYPTGGASPSCPYIYCWDGKNYELQGEAFGTALGRALEFETSIILKNYNLSENTVNIKITNERPETHFFNSIEVVGIETASNNTVYSDNRNSFFSVKNHKNIFKAEDVNKTDITDLLLDNDNKHWISNLSSALASRNFEDVLFIELEDVNEIDSLSLIVTALNTEISNVLFKYLDNLLGEEFINFTKAAETDPEIIEILKNMLERSALKVDIWDGRDWKNIGLLYPEASSVEFSKLIRVPVVYNNDGRIRIRLRCLTDVWQIEAVKYDDLAKDSYILHDIKLLDVKSNTHDQISHIFRKDDLYTKLLPGQYIEMIYEQIKVPSQRKITYAVRCQGYLYEWIIDNSSDNSYLYNNLRVDTPKLYLVKKILSDFDNILPLIYSDWKRSRDAKELEIGEKF